MTKCWNGARMAGKLVRHERSIISTTRAFPQQAISFRRVPQNASIVCTAAVAQAKRVTYRDVF